MLDEERSQEETDEEEGTEDESSEEESQEESQEDSQEESEEEESSEESSIKKDPLDDMSDGDLTRFATTFGITLKEGATRDENLLEIKKVRGIKQRRIKELTPTSDDEGDEKSFVKARDFEKSFEEQARESLEESSNPFDKAILDHWDEVASRYVNRSGRTSAKKILADIREAAAGYFHTANIQISEDDARVAAANVGAITGIGIPTGQGRDKQKKRIIPKRRGMESWYTKK